MLNVMEAVHAAMGGRSKIVERTTLRRSLGRGYERHVSAFRRSGRPEWYFDAIVTHWDGNRETVIDRAAGGPFKTKRAALNAGRGAVKIR